MEVPRRRGGGTRSRTGDLSTVDECTEESSVSRQSKASRSSSARSPAFIFQDTPSSASEASSYYYRRRGSGATADDSNSEASSSVRRMLKQYTSTSSVSTHPIIRALIAEPLSVNTDSDSDTTDTNTNNSSNPAAVSHRQQPSYTTTRQHPLYVAPPPTRKTNDSVNNPDHHNNINNPFMSYLSNSSNSGNNRQHNSSIGPSHSFPTSTSFTATPQKRGGVLRSNSNPLSPESTNNIDVSDLTTSISMISPYTSSCSEAESSTVASPSSFSAASGGGGGSFLPVKSLLKTPTSTSSSKNKSKPLHHFADQSEEEDDDNNNNNNNNGTSGGWTLSPASIASIPEEEQNQQQQKQPDRQQRPPRPQGGGGSTRSNKSSKKVMSSPSSAASSPPSSSFSTMNLSNHISHNSTTNMMDNSSLAQESSVASASGIFSEGTGFHSEVTEVIRNSCGLTRVVVGNKQRDIESDGAIPIQGPIRPPISMIPSIILETDEDQQQQHHQPQPQVQLQLPQQEQEQQQVPEKYKRSFSKSLFKGSQGWIIGSLVALFVFGLITVIVSFVLSKDEQPNNHTTVIDDPTATVGGGAAIPNDDTFDNPFLNNEGDDTTPFAGPNVNGTEPTTTVNGVFTDSPFSSSVPTTSPSMDEEDALFADAVEELLSGAKPSSLPPSMAPSTKPKTTQFPSRVPSVSPGVGGTAISSELITLVDPTTPKPTTITATIPPTPIPTESVLLHADANFQQEAKLLGRSNGDAAGSSVALSSNGQILLVGSPNANSPTTGFERAGEVNVYKRQYEEEEAGVVQWMLRATIRSEQEEELDQLGFSVATNHDGSVVVVSEPTADRRRGRVTIYAWENEREIYVAQQILRGGLGTTDHFGISISLSDTGRRLAVGSPYHSTTTSDNNLRGKVQVFEYSTVDQTWNIMKTWREEGLVGAANLDWFGWSVSLSKDGEVLSVGAPRNTEFGGYVQCFRYDNVSSEWEYLGPPILNVIPPIKLDDRFGHSTSITNTASRPPPPTDDVGLEENGSKNSVQQGVIRVAVGAPWKDVGTTLNSGMVAIYEWNEVSWTWSLYDNNNNNNKNDNDDDGTHGSILVEDEPGFYHQLGYSIAMEGDLISVGTPGYDGRRGMVNLYWLPHAFGGEPKKSVVNSATVDETKNNNNNNSPWERLTYPLTGEAEGDDFGFSVSSAVVLQHSTTTAASRHQQDPMITIASGAIMVSTTTTMDDEDEDTTTDSSTGYSMVFQRRGHLY